MNRHLSRRQFVKNTGLLTTWSFIFPTLTVIFKTSTSKKKESDSIRISTNFVSGGGSISVIQTDPVVLRLQPHNQRNGGWSQVWWYFKVDGMTPGEELIIQLDLGEPKVSGISQKASFSYDQVDWGLTDTGKFDVIDGIDLFVYKHIVRSKSVWFAYDLPYIPEQLDSLLLSKAISDPYADVFELCKTVNNRPVKGIKFNASEKNSQKHGIWLQARTHAFESGSSWVLHELTDWLLSNNKDAQSLRKFTDITVVPIVDVDAVVEGRTGKLQKPYDHNRGWDQTSDHWPQTSAIKSSIKDLSKDNMIDMFIDFHGPGNESHPYFITLASEDLPNQKQRENRAKFFELLNAKPMDAEAAKTQSMSQIHYSARPLERIAMGNSASWVSHNATDNTVALTLEVNMNTPLSIRSGYRSEALALGKAMSKYFIGGYHQK